MPHAKSRTGVVAKHEYKVPSYVTIYNFLKTLDLDDFARRLTEWMSAQEGTLPRQLAFDGKFVKEVMGIVSVVNVENGVPVAVAVCSRKEGETGRCERISQYKSKAHRLLNWQTREEREPVNQSGMLSSIQTANVESRLHHEM